MTERRKIGIIGVGPRGSYALENLVVELANTNSLTNIQVSLFEATGKFGHGPVYDIFQASTNWINITERVLELKRRGPIDVNTLKIPLFPSYHEWVGKDFKTIPTYTADTYPPRAQIGEYLSQRFESLIEPLINSNIAFLYEEKIIEVKLLDNNKIEIKSNTTTYEDFDEILLTIGHQPTKLSQQISEWDDFAANNEDINLFKSPYPIADFLNCKNLNEKSTIGIRGFGLAMIDVVRGIAEKFGTFIITDEKTKSCRYCSDHGIKDTLVPFSLDGLPPVPKPLNAQIDKWFEPTKEQILDFEEKIGSDLIQKNAKGPQFLMTAFAPIAANIFLNLPIPSKKSKLSKEEIEELVIRWLGDNTYEHSLITSIYHSAKKNMQDFVAMATGEKSVSLDFCIGQVWRHCQPSIYEQLSFNQCSDTVVAEIIALDESTKRYSYGPPVESIQQLMALVEAGFLNLNWVNSPDIDLTEDGWSFKSVNESITVNIMIDSVLDSPKIKAVNSPVVKSMISDQLIEAVHDDLGVTTDSNGYLIPKNKDTKIPIALLGRLAKGTIIGVDAILECYGERPRKWAKQAADNHTDWLNKTMF
ncbi:FAD/NAD(P)-binding protein [Maribacter luteus]|uniref:FAD-dependent urate hydroxylase HpyO/Asp monooxygenase CreE-like FAD/NAD(P)-binding domain-containing protein n=1 Tax=Maribacter luteus TaxID=2594478 RepID=A0A6I2MFV3_9FLAO|nr:FAD/NAD(P)-binding protein [Maribacter luteus]MRX62608.1 hypothetical protein [Maribacter luteus]|tara:strand:+ start:2610 stop:4370 length:1761 start_codon:yes stop_codon:yes gene_type:complete